MQIFLRRIVAHTSITRLRGLRTNSDDNKECEKKELMFGWQEVEVVATFFNIGANVAMLLYMLQNPHQRVPINVIYMQMCGNISWIASSVMRGDPYLCITAGSSLLVQSTTTFVLVRTRRRDQLIKLSDSTEELPSQPKQLLR